MSPLVQPWVKQIIKCESQWCCDLFNNMMSKGIEFDPVINMNQH